MISKCHGCRNYRDITHVDINGYRWCWTCNSPSPSLSVPRTFKNDPEAETLRSDDVAKALSEPSAEWLAQECPCRIGISRAQCSFHKVP